MKDKNDLSEVNRHLKSVIEGVEDSFSNCPYANDINWGKMFGTLFWKYICVRQKSYPEALEVVSEVVVRLLLNKDRLIANFRGSGTFGGYVYRVLQSYVLMYYREQRKRVQMVYVEDDIFLRLLGEIALAGASVNPSSTSDSSSKSRICSYAVSVEPFDEGSILITEFKEYLVKTYPVEGVDMSQMCDWVVDGGSVKSFSNSRNMDRARGYRMYQDLRACLHTFLNRGILC